MPNHFNNSTMGLLIILIMLLYWTLLCQVTSNRVTGTTVLWIDTQKYISSIGTTYHYSIQGKMSYKVQWCFPYLTAKWKWICYWKTGISNNHKNTIFLLNTLLLLIMYLLSCLEQSLLSFCKNQWTKNGLNLQSMKTQNQINCEIEYWL